MLEIKVPDSAELSALREVAPVLYSSAIALSFLSIWIAVAIYATVSIT